MAFHLKVTRTVNGVPRTMGVQLSDEERTFVEQNIADFQAGRLPMERTLTLSAGRSPEDPEWARSCRWIDVKKMWIEEI